MKESNGKKVISVFLVGLMLFSGLSVLASAVSNGSTVTASQETANTPASAITNAEVQKENAWVNKIDPSLIDGVNAGSKDMVKVTVLTKDMGAVNPIISKYMSQNIEGKRVTPTLKTDTVSGVPVTKTITVPYYALKDIASVPSVMGVYRFAPPVPADIHNQVLTEAQQHLEQMKAEGDVPPMPMDYTTPVEHKADAAWSMGYSGSGVNVAVVDTGIDFANPDLMGQWAVDNNPNSSYYGWPIMWDPVSMDLLDGYFTAGNDWDRFPYPIFASYGESSWYSDTTYVAQKNATGYVNYTNMNNGYWTKRYDPNGYGNGDMNRISRNYYVGNITSVSGNYHLGIAKDDHLTAYAGERVGMLVVDSTTPGVYDTVYVDLNNNLDFTDDKPVNKSSPLCYEDINNDGIPDISGGLLYFISNTQGSVTGEEIMNSTAEARDSAKLAHGHIVTDVDAYYSLWSTLMLYLNGTTYLPFYSEPIYQDIVTNGTGVSANSTFYLNDTSVGFSTYNPVNFTYLHTLGFNITDGSFSLTYGNSTDEYDMTESDTPGFLNYTFDPTTGKIKILFDMENDSYIYAMYQMDTYTLDFTTGDVSFMTDIPAGMNVTADYDYGLSLPYSDVYTERMGYDNFIPASGDLVAFFGDFDAGQDHGTLCASSIAGTLTSMTYGTAPSAKIIGVGDFYNSAGYDAWYFAVEGYDGIPDTGDEAQIVSNSFGAPSENADGWDYASRLAYDITTNYAPNSTFVVAAGNDGWGYGTVTSPGSAPGVITAGAGINMAYRWLIGSDGGEPGDWMNYFYPDTSWYGDVADFSGRGPTALGTPDPDVLAVGEFAIGSIPLNENAVDARDSSPPRPVDGNDAWDLWAGTSLATPVTAGVLALVYQSYHDNHNNTWPSGDVAKKILTSSCDDHGYDPLQQGAGWLNASLAVQMAAEMNGVSSDTMYWTPGDYHGQKLDASVHLIDPGASDSTQIAFSNHDLSSPATVDLSDAIYNKTGEYTFNITTNTYDVRIIKPDGVYLADGTQEFAEPMTTEWNNADFMKVTAYTEQDGAYPYMELSDWIDRAHYGNETAFNSSIINVDNETLVVGHYGETHAYFNNSNLLPGAPMYLYSNGTLLTEGADYLLNTTTGTIYFTDPSNPLYVGNETAFNSSITPFNGTVIVGNGTQNSTILPYLPIYSGTPILVYSNGTLLDNSTGGNYTINMTSGVITFLNDSGAVRNLTVNETINVSYAYYLPVYAGAEYRLSRSPLSSYHVWFTNETGVVMEWLPSGGNFTLDNATGKILLNVNLTAGEKVTVDYSIDARALSDGETITMTYTQYVPVKSGDYYVLGNSPVTAYTVSFTNASGNTTDWTSSLGTNFTFNATTGNITLLTDLNPGEKVSVEYYWEHPGVYDGATERIRMNVNLRQANLVSTGIYDPSSRIDDGLIWSMKDVNVLFLGAEPVNISFKVTVEFYQKADWSWLTTNVTSLNIPAGGTANITANITVPADAPVGAYEGSIVYVVNGHTSIIPVLVNVPATTFPVHFGGNVPTTSLYENGAGMGGYGGGASGDWRFYFVDVNNLKVEDARKLLMMEYWNHPDDDWEMYLFGAESDPYFSGEQYGDFRLVQVAGTKEAVGLTDTLVPGSEILSTDMMNGPFEIAIRGMKVSGESMLSEVHGDLGYMSVSPNNLDIYTSDTAGSVPVTVYSNIDLYKGIGSAVTYSKSRTWAKQPVDPYPYSSGSYEVYLANAPNQVVLTIPEQTVSATFSLYFYNGANDVDMGIYYDANEDGIAETDELIVPDSQTATLNNPEVGSLMFPPAGTYIVKAAGYDVAPGSLFDLTVKTLGIGKSAFSAVNAANTTIPAGTPSTFGVGWDFGDTAPTGDVKTLMLVSPGAAPYALVLPIDITLHYDANAPSIGSPTPASGAVVQSAPLICLTFDDSSPINTKMSTMSVDGMDVSANVQFTDTSVVYNTKGLSDGLHTVAVKLVDMVGNTATYSWGFTVDSAAPVLSVDVPQSTSASTVMVKGTTEPGAAVTVNGNAVDVSSDGTFEYRMSISAGQTIVDVVATDLAGNTAEVTRTIFMDNSAPGLTVVVPVAVSSSETVISGTVTGLDSEVGPVSVTINGVPVTVNADGTFSLPVTLLEGSNEFTIVVTDAAGNSYTLQKSITLDSTPPTLSATVPSTSASSSLSISGSTTGASKLLVNGKQVMLGSDGSFTTTVSLSPGSNVIVITAMDAMGNSVERTYTVDYTSADLIPVVSTSAPAQSAPALTAGGGVLAVVLLIIGLIIGFLAKMFMGGRGGKPETEGPVEEEAEFTPAPEEGLEEAPEETGEEPSAEEAESAPSDEGAEEESPETEEIPFAEESESDSEPESEPSSESEEDSAEDEDEDKGDVIDLSDI